ncbi:MAG TPA: phospholipase D-like domain-containing protein, partial [Gemmatimonadaceae bacterium]|nr:phospholipase D-like domain-containing protein [Gemmatimonadaceae bacterium]
LLEGGVRVFEWNGSMLHVKTAVADGRWSRVGSTNLNPSSWIGNWELDVAIDDHGFARLLEQQYEEDLDNATEIVLTDRQRVKPLQPRPLAGVRGGRRRRRRGSAGRATAGAIGIGSAVGAAMRNRRALGPSEARPLAAVGSMLLLWALAAANWPKIVGWPFAVIVGWWALSLLVRSWHLHQEGRERRRNVAQSAENPSAERQNTGKF